MFRSGRLRWTGNVTGMGERKGAYRVLVGKPEGKRPLGRPRHVWGTMLKWMFEKWDHGALAGSMWLGIGIGA
jgi:hypothetical protein